MQRRARKSPQEPSLFDSDPVPGSEPEPEPERSPALRRAERPAAERPAAARPETRQQPPLYSVGQLTKLVNGRLQDLGRVRVEGEVAQCKRTASGHVFFDMKEAGSKLACKIWKSQAARILGFDLAEGVQVVAWGRLDVYAPQGSYSLLVDRMEPLGIGVLLAQLEQRKAELRARGWFERTRTLPAFPRTIGLVTSRDGAALRDFLRTRSLRFPGYPLRIVHTPVQGPSAAPQIAAALRAMDASGVDVIALVRGGGSLEDLWAFNELPVAEAIWNASVPVVTGVGHESDTTLADLVADHRAHTPTDAAQTLIPDRRQLSARAARLGNYLTAAFERRFAERSERLQQLSARPVLRDAAWILGERTRTLRALHQRLAAALGSALERRRGVLSHAHARLARRTPTAELASRLGRLSTAHLRLTGSLERSLERRTAALEAKARSLEAVSPLAVLGRGYSITRRLDSSDSRGDSRGDTLSDATTLSPGDAVETRLAHGSFRARVESVRPADEGA